MKAPLNNASFTGNIRINLLSTDTLDSALLIKGARNDNPTKEGIRMGYSQNVIVGSRCYGIEVCSQYDAASTIDFSYPGSYSYYLGRMVFSNSQGIFGWSARTAMSTTEIAAGNYQMYLTSGGELVVENKLSVPAISLNNTDLQSSLNNNFNGIVNTNNTLPSF